MTGRIHPSKTMFLREHVGEANGERGIAYDLTVDMATRVPIVESKQTGKWFTLSWQEIIEFAVAAGIDTPDSPPKSKRARLQKKQAGKEGGER